MSTVTLLYLDGCPNWQLLDRRLRDLEGEFDLTVERRRDTGRPATSLDGI